MRIMSSRWACARTGRIRKHSNVSTFRGVVAPPSFTGGRIKRSTCSSLREGNEGVASAHPQR
jgi:hypothetical protein